MLEFYDMPHGRTYARAGWKIKPPELHDDVYGIHHPRRAIKKYSTGKIIRRRDTDICNARGDRCRTLENGIDVDWGEGTTEPGSSGSGLFVEDYLIGVLSGGRGSCTTDISNYGSFVDFFPLVRQWLQPN